MDSHPDDNPDDREFPAPPLERLPLPHLSRWARWPILMYLTIVVVFGILAIFVVHYVLTHVPSNS
jgi:hypothetical protein